MDEHLFSKHLFVIKKNTDIKNSIITVIQEKTGVLLHKEEISILKKTISITTTTTKRSILLRNKIDLICLELGYFYKK